MRRVSACLLALAIACALFAYWGMFTSSGTHAFDEMAGMIPFFVGLTSGPLVLGAVIAGWLSRRCRNVEDKADRRARCEH
jgi:hypothetical protein